MMDTAIARVEVVSMLPIDGICDLCLFPSLAVVTFAIWNDPRSVSPAQLTSRTACLECGEPQ